MAAASSWRALSPLIHEMRINICPKSVSSRGIREFTKQWYRELKLGNPKVPVLVRFQNGIHPSITLRRDFGKEVVVDCKAKSGPDIEVALRNVLK